MKAPKEELRLITSESELRVGMLVECSRCLRCPSKHRYLLLSSEYRDKHSVGCCESRSGRAWFVGQNAHLKGDALSCFEGTIVRKALYEVREKGQDDEAEQREWKDLVKDSQCRIRKPQRVDP